MKGRDKLFFNLLTFLLLVVIGLVGYQTREVDKQINRWRSEIQKREDRGMHDPQLKETVDNLEAELAARLAETFVLDPDPLDLTRVIKTKDFLKRLGMKEAGQTDNTIRLSCTVMGENSASAIVNYRGKSHVLMVGDKIGLNSPYNVTNVGLNTLTLVRGRETLKLKTEKSPDRMAAEEARLENEKPVTIEVKQLTGNL